ncbi:hypothetical protein VTI74DRAFT_10334 [Chaetomium olivicolor]
MAAQNGMRILTQSFKAEEHYPRMIPKHCEVCKTTDNLLRCGGCETYYYCGRDHQLRDRPTHKTTCKTIKNSKATVREIEAKLRSGQVVPENVLDTEAGQLWRLGPVRPYLQAIFVQAETLVRSWRRQGIEDALDAYLKLLRLDRSDRQGARFLIPALYLRLGRDQEAYDFSKGWAYQFRGTAEAKQLEDPDQAYLHVKDADATEGVELWTGSNFMQLPFVSSVALVKMRLVLSLEYVRDARSKIPAGSPVPSVKEILDPVRGDWCGDIIERLPVEVFASDSSMLEKRE